MILFFFIFSHFFNNVMLSHFSHVRLFVTSWTIAWPGSSVHGILQVRILEWVPIFINMKAKVHISLNSRHFSYPLDTPLIPLKCSHTQSKFLRKLQNFCSKRLKLVTWTKMLEGTQNVCIYKPIFIFTAFIKCWII